jgi:hypothetical protein
LESKAEGAPNPAAPCHHRHQISSSGFCCVIASSSHAIPWQKAKLQQQQQQRGVTSLHLITPRSTAHVKQS